MGKQYKNSTSRIVSSKYYFIGTAIVIAFAYYGVIQPARRHMALLQQQCDQLATVVSKLDNRGNAAGRSLHLMDLLDQQGSKIAAAETALREIIDLRRRLVDESQQVATAMGALDKLEDIRLQVVRHGRTLAQTSEVLQQMDQVAISIASSRDTVQEAQGTMQELDRLQSKFVEGLAMVSGKFPAMEPVVEDVQALCEHLVSSEDLVQRATVVSQQMASLQGEILRASKTLPQAEHACQRIDSLCKKMGKQSTTVEVAGQQLEELGRLKSEVLAQTQGLSDVAGILTQVWELRDGLLHTTGTLSDLQHLLVDMMLLEPAVQRAKLTLKPVIELTRLSRQIESHSAKAVTTGKAGEQEASAGSAGAKNANANASANVNGSIPQTSWTEMLEGAFAWCQQTLK